MIIIASKNRETKYLIMDILSLLYIATLSWVYIFPLNFDSITYKFIFAMFFVPLTALSSYYSSPGQAQTTSVLCISILGFYTLGGPLYFWPLHLILPIFFTYAIGHFKWNGFKLNDVLPTQLQWKSDFGWSVVIGLCAASVVTIWSHIAHPDLSDIRELLLSGHSALILAIAGCLFSVCNSILEEFVWRGTLLPWLRQVFPTPVAILIQALSFGAAHWHGLPSGLSGACLATLFGMLLGFITVYRKNLFAPILAHCFADIAVFAILIWG